MRGEIILASFSCFIRLYPIDRIKQHEFVCHMVYFYIFEMFQYKYISY